MFRPIIPAMLASLVFTTSGLALAKGENETSALPRWCQTLPRMPGRLYLPRQPHGMALVLGQSEIISTSSMARRNPVGMNRARRMYLSLIKASAISDINAEAKTPMRLCKNRCFAMTLKFLLLQI